MRSSRPRSDRRDFESEWTSSLSPRSWAFSCTSSSLSSFKSAIRRFGAANRRKDEKDIVHIPDAYFSVEIKTSSHKSQVFGNRSYRQPATRSEIGRKGKSGYYLTVNFEKFGNAARPQLKLIRLGWLDHDDWLPQESSTGQSARLRPEAYEHKLVTLWP
jgi:hypothetical protein